MQSSNAVFQNSLILSLNFMIFAKVLNLNIVIVASSNYDPVTSTYIHEMFNLCVIVPDDHDQ